MKIYSDKLSEAPRERKGEIKVFICGSAWNLKAFFLSLLTSFCPEHGRWKEKQEIIDQRSGEEERVASFGRKKLQVLDRDKPVAKFAREETCFDVQS